MTTDRTNITILGAGAWGTALAIALAPRHDVVLWGREVNAMREAEQKRENLAYLPGFFLPESLHITTDFDAALAHVTRMPDASNLLIIASSVAGLRPLSQQLRHYPIPNLIWLCKGFEETSGLLPHQVVASEITQAIPVGALSGPSFAQEVAQGLPCALTIASESEALCQLVADTIHGGNLRVYSSDDVVGVEVGGAVKNILAIATGIADGMELGMNARAALITRGMAEITRLGQALGGRTETFMGLTGFGDVILTCTGDLSRNRRVGLSLAKGKTLNDIIAELGHVAEGVRCVRAVCSISDRLGIDMPITHAVAAVLFGGASLPDMVKKLLARNNRAETD